MQVFTLAARGSLVGAGKERGKGAYGIVAGGSVAGRGCRSTMGELGGLK